MPDLPEKKVGIIACSGEEIAEGTVTRLAALKVLHELRRGNTVTICLPLFLAGGEGDRAFAKFHPTITVDGCELRCAAKGTERYSGKPAAGIVVRELAAGKGINGIGGRRNLNEAGKKAVEAVADHLVELIDSVLGRDGRYGASSGGEGNSANESATVTCSCGSGIPVKVIDISGRPVEVVALPLIFAKLEEAGRGADGAFAGELLDMVKVYNYVAPEEEAAWRDALVREYESGRKGGEQR